MVTKKRSGAGLPQNIEKLKWLKSPYFIALVVLAGFLLILTSNVEKSSKNTDIILEDKELEARLNSIYESITSGGPPKDGIPPIENPDYISMAEADEILDDRDVVFVAEFDEAEEKEKGVFVYPQKILVWHEIVNEKINGESVSITYCPLTGSAVGFKGKLSVQDKESGEIETTFGTSGKLSNSNLVMYDRETDSYIPQILGVAVSGELKGQRLKEFPVIFTRWENVKAAYSNGENDNVKVLSENTGFIRNYNRDPYGSYLSKGNYYDSGGSFFPVMHQDKRFSDKEVVMGGRIIVNENGESVEKPFAILKSSVKDRSVMEFEVGGETLTAFYDESLDTVRVYKSENELINTFDVMWFAWVAFYPETEVFE